jgi:hypothetical protein
MRLGCHKLRIEIQKFLHDYNVSSKDDWKIKLRNGIHLGDVVSKRNDIIGAFFDMAPTDEAALFSKD